MALDGRSTPNLLDNGVSRRVLITNGLCALAVLLLHPTSSATAHKGRLILNTAFGPPISTPDGQGFFDRLARELFGRLGYAVATQSPPAERALMLANSGVDDGDGPRVADLNHSWNYPNLVRVSEKLLDVEFTAFTLDPTLQITGWSSLRQHQVGIVTGWKILERQLANEPGVVKVKDPQHLFMLLKHRRTEIVVVDRFSGIETARRLGIVGLRNLRPALAVTPMFLYLNSKHAALASRASDELSAMKRDGSYQQIYRETLGHVITADHTDVV